MDDNSGFTCNSVTDAVFYSVLVVNEAGGLNKVLLADHAYVFFWNSGIQFSRHWEAQVGGRA